MAETRQNLTVHDIAAIAALGAKPHEARAFFAAIDALAKRTIGHRLFTILRPHAANDEVERIYSSNEAAFPIGGRKRKAATSWATATIERGEVFIARDEEGVKKAHPDHALIFSLGVGAIMNVPVAFNGARLCAVNIGHQSGWFTDADVETGRALGALLAPALMTVG